MKRIFGAIWGFVIEYRSGGSGALRADNSLNMCEAAGCNTVGVHREPRKGHSLFSPRVCAAKADLIYLKISRGIIPKYSYEFSVF
jgi:hypothetical protein